MTLFADYGTLLIVVTCLFGFFMAWGVGANDVANAMGTSVGARALTVKQAICIAMVFEFMGAYLAGGEVTSTIRKGIIDASVMENNPELLVFGMMSALLAAGVWLVIASMKGWPVSTTHSIVGAIVGFAMVGVSMDAVEWGTLGTIIASWVISPLLAGVISFLLFRSVHLLILDTDDPFENARRFIPFYMFGVGFLIAMVTLLKGLKHVLKDQGVGMSFGDSMVIAVLIGFLVMFIGMAMIRRINYAPNPRNRFASVERIFAILMIFTACSMAFAHGSNDVANAVGPLAAVVGIVQTGLVSSKSAMPSWVLLIGALGIVLGLATYGWKVMGTIGRKITELTPSRGFAAELGASATVVLASGTGLPISTTHTLVGAVLGVGLARGIGAINLRIVGMIFTSWLITLPTGAFLSIVFFYTIKAIFT